MKTDADNHTNQSTSPAVLKFTPLWQGAQIQTRTTSEWSFVRRSFEPTTTLESSLQRLIVDVMCRKTYGPLTHPKEQASVVLDSATHRVNLYQVVFFSLILIRWIEIYPVDSAIQRVNNFGQELKLVIFQARCLNNKLENNWFL